MAPEIRSVVKMPLRCTGCHTRWDEYFSLPMNVKVFVKKGKAIACPKCGGKDILMGLTQTETVFAEIYNPVEKDALEPKEAANV